MLVSFTASCSSSSTSPLDASVRWHPSFKLPTRVFIVIIDHTFALCVKKLKHWQMIPSSLNIAVSIAMKLVKLKDKSHTPPPPPLFLPLFTAYHPLEDKDVPPPSSLLLKESYSLEERVYFPLLFSSPSNSAHFLLLSLLLHPFLLLFLLLQLIASCSSSSSSKSPTPLRKG